MISLDPLLDDALFLVSHLASFAAMAASAWIFGETALRRMAIESRRSRWALAGALGWGLIVQSIFFLGLLGLLQRAVVLGLLALGHLLCHRTWRSVLDCWARRRRACKPWSVAIALAVASPCFVLALYPPTGFDATVYHLPYARAFVDAGELPFLPDLRFPVFPQAGEMGFVLGFFLSGDVAAKLTQLLAVLLAAGLLFDWGSLYGRRAGIWAAALWLGNPLIVWLGTSAYVDATLALFLTAAFTTWERWTRDGDRRWLWLAGTFAGLAAGTKYLGLFFLAALGLLTAMRAISRRDVRPSVTLVAVALTMLAPWYLRILYHTGSPVFPFYAPIFGDSEWSNLHDQALPTTGAGTLWAVAESQVGRIFEGLSFLARVPWTAIFDRGVFHWQAPLTPYYLLLLPWCVPIGLFERRTRRLLVLVAAYGLFWLTTVRDLRFLVAAMPALNVALAATLGRWPPVTKELRSLAMPISAALLLAPGVLYAGYKLYEHGPLPVSEQQRTAYLTRQVPGYEAITAMNQAEGRDYTVFALYGENLRYYAAGRFLGDWFGPARFSRIEAVLGDSRALARELRSWGACFLLVRHSRPRDQMPADDFFQQSFRLESEGAGFALYRFLDVDCTRGAG